MEHLKVAKNLIKVFLFHLKFCDKEVAKLTTLHVSHRKHMRTNKAVRRDSKKRRILLNL